MKRNTILLILSVLAVVGAAGCSSLIEINPRAMTTDEIIAMSEADVSADVIISQIYSTGSRFELTSEEIIRLKKAGVDDTVIEAMVNAVDRSPVHDYDYYDPYYPGSLAFRYDIYNSWSPMGYYYPHGYGAPYIVRRQDGLLGRFYEYEPAKPYLRRRHRPYYERRYVPPTDEEQEDEDNDSGDNR